MFYMIGWALISDDSEGAASEMLAMPFAADLCLPRLRDVVRDAEGEVSIVLDRYELHRYIGPAHAHFQEATPSSIAAVDGEAARCL